GIDKSVGDKYFGGAVSRIGGLSLDDVAREALAKHWRGFQNSRTPKNILPECAMYQGKRHAEGHLNNRHAVHLLQQSCRIGVSKTAARQRTYLPKVVSTSGSVAVKAICGIRRPFTCYSKRVAREISKHSKNILHRSTIRRSICLRFADCWISLNTAHLFLWMRLNLLVK